MTALRQAWPTPSHPRPIVIIGAGAIVRTAHLPAYRRLDYPIGGLFDISRDAAEKTAQQFGVARVFRTLADACSTTDAVFDMAVPGNQILDVLQCLPRGSAVLIQKPMGRDLAEAIQILDACKSRGMTAAVNLQLRFSPAMLALRALIARGTLGALTDIDLHLVIEQPWHLWTFMIGAPRLELVEDLLRQARIAAAFLPCLLGPLPGPGLALAGARSSAWHGNGGSKTGNKRPSQHPSVSPKTACGLLW